MLFIRAELLPASVVLFCESKSAKSRELSFSVVTSGSVSISGITTSSPEEASFHSFFAVSMSKLFPLMDSVAVLVSGSYSAFTGSE